MKRLLAITILLISVLRAHAATTPVQLVRTPDGGVQPRAVISGGRVHVVYFRGDPRHGDFWYTSSTDNGAHWTPPHRVNSVPGSGVARGNVRGAQLAVGADGTVHVAWNAADSDAFLYARSTDGGRSFSAQHALNQTSKDMDGGGDIVCDGRRVLAFWHAAKEKGGPRQVYVRASEDSGTTFSAERAVSDAGLGCCECCGLRATVDARGAIYVIYRAARGGVERDIWCLTSTDGARTFASRRLHGWHVTGCPVSTMSIIGGKDGALAAWETEGQICMARLTPQAVGAIVQAPGHATDRKHPAVSEGPQGTVLLSWIEGMTYGQPGRLMWQTYDVSLQPLQKGQPATVPAWDLLAAWWSADRFNLLY